MNSSDYRAIARAKLANNWGSAILAAFVAALLGGTVANVGFRFNVTINEQTLYQLPEFVLRYLMISASIASMLSFVHFIIGGVVRQGYAVYLLKQYDGGEEKPELNDLFSQFHHFGDGFCLALLQTLYILLWGLLFIIPGIVAAYRYAMAPYILAENPGMTASEAITASKQMMEGHKGELFCLGLSFFGWAILSGLTLGIGSLWLTPYMNAAYTAFYRNLSQQNAVE